jgi:NAD(P)H-dependent FMN reductase
MGYVLGIVGSARRWGNSELLIRQALRGAQEEGTAIRLLRLTDLHLESCNGCLRCVIGSRPCPIRDDVDWLLESIKAADGLALAVPTYFLGPAAAFKLVLDRLLMVTGRLDRELPPPRPAITMVTAGLAGWRGVTLPYLNALTATFGYRPIESLTAIAPGPGEVLLDGILMDRVLIAGRRLARGELDPAPPPPNACPTCFCDAFVLDGDQATCPICGRTATLHHEEGLIRLDFSPLEDGDHRWTPEGMRKHMVEWVMATGPRFLARRQEIKDRRRPYRQMDAEWLRPQPAHSEL